MRCSPCGARYETPSARCPECGARQEGFQSEPAPSLEPHVVAATAEAKVVKPAKKSKLIASAPKVEASSILTEQEPAADEKLTEPKSSEPIPEPQTAPVTASEVQVAKPVKRPKLRKPTPSLIEFPGVTALPQWRRELGERVRERRARESVAASAPAGSFCGEMGASATATLELLPQTEAPEVNPIVVAALRRLERARGQSSMGSSAVAFAMETQPQVDSLTPTPEMKIEPELPKPERVHNLAVVPDPEPIAEPEEEAPQSVRKQVRPVRMIGDQNDPALNYLDSIPTSVTVDDRGHQAAPIFLRILSAITDIVVIAVLSLPFLTLTEFTNASLDDWRVIGFLAGIISVVTFLYLTINVAFTGRTVGMRLFSLRVVDARNGLIPTGSQAAGRAFVYVLSLASAGVVLLFTFIDREKYALHDRLTRTAVVRA